MRIALLRFLHNPQRKLLGSDNWKSSLLVLGILSSFQSTICDDTNSSDCIPASVGGFASPSGCILQEIKSTPLRVVYLDKQYVTQNQAAIAKVGSAYVFGRTCENAATAVPECFVAENWKAGWLGQFMWGVFSNYLNLDNSNIAAMTTLNFTGATNPKNATSVYKGASSFTRCVWEINLGNVDICVGDFWETQERRGIAAFTTAIAVDKFLLVTMSVTDTQPPMLVFPSAFDPSSLATIFLPLTWQVWLLHIAMMVFGAAAILFMESTGSYLRGPGDDIDSDSGGSDGGSGGQRLSFNGLLKSMYAAFIHFLWNGPKHDTRTVGGKLALFALSFHTLVIAASYTASLAGFLSTPSSVPIVVLSFESIQSSPLTSLAGKLCVLQSAQGLFSALQPEKLVGMDNYGPMYEQLYRGKCGSLVTGVNEYLVFAQGERTAFSICANESDPLGYATCQNGGPTKVINLFQCTCPKNPRADPSTCPDDCPYIDRYKNVVPSDQSGFDAWYNWALPVRQDYAEVISNAILASRLNNDLDTSRKEQLLSNVTAKFNAQGVPSTLSSIITVESIVSVYIYTAALVGLALLIHFLQACSGRIACGSCGMNQKATGAREKSLATDDVGKVKMASVIPAGLPSMQSGSFGPSKLRLGGEDGSAGMHLDLLCQRLAQLDKELDMKLSSGRLSPANIASGAKISGGSFSAEDISTEASPARAPGPSKVQTAKVQTAPKTDIPRNNQTAARLFEDSFDDDDDFPIEVSAQSNGGRKVLPNVTTPKNMEIPAEARVSSPQQMRDQMHTIGSGDVAPDLASFFNNKSAIDDEVDGGKEESQEMMAPFQHILSTVLCFAKKDSRLQPSEEKMYKS